jgi:hypothetical protein
MLNRNALVPALLLGTVLQLIMVIAGHYDAFVRDHVFAFGGMAISLVAGLYYGLSAGGGWGERLLGGAIAGAACAFIGIAVSVVLKDTAALILVIGTVSSAVTGLIGGAASKLVR